MYYKIVNPETGRKVNINSKLGQQILRNYTQQQQIGGTTLSEVAYKVTMLEEWMIKFHEEMFKGFQKDGTIGGPDAHLVKETFSEFKSRYMGHLRDTVFPGK